MGHLVGMIVIEPQELYEAAVAAIVIGALYVLYVLLRKKD